MRFKSFKIKNFKGIEDITIPLDRSPSGNIYTLVGLNESGKTTILEAISYMSQGIDETESLRNDNEQEKDFRKFVPKNKKSNFSEEIKIKCVLEFEKGEKEKIRKFCLKELELQLNLDALTDSIKIESVLSFSDSKCENLNNRWDVAIETKEKGKRKWKSLKAEDSAWQIIVSHIRTYIPSISYFPTFLFDFPEKIFLEELPNENEKNAYYRSIIQDVLSSLDAPLDIKKHIIDRLKKEDGTVRNPYSSSDEIEQVEHAMLKLGEKISQTIFNSWGKIFGVKINNKRIVAKHYIEIVEENKYVCLKFNMEDNGSIYSISERSLGFRWFFCFLLFTQFRSLRKNQINTLFLFDEPASNLHSKAQIQLLQSFPKITENGCKVMYSTHSHYMIEPKWLENTFIVANKGLNYDVMSEEYSPPKDTKITITPYRQFIGQGEEKFTYFQPILDQLAYTPSNLEAISEAVILEGKNDFYTLQYFSEIIFKDKLKINFMPGTGANGLDDILALYLGWGRNFIVCLDDDKAGQECKKDCLAEWLLPEKKVLTLGDCKKEWKQFKMENLISDEDKIIIREYYCVKGKLSKKKIAHFFQEKLALEEVVSFSDETKSNFRFLIDFLNEKLENL